MQDSAPQRIVIKRTQKKLTQEERVGFLIIAITGGITLILGSLFIVRNVNKPFDLSYEGPLFLTTAQERAIEAEEQKTKDTDGDGITDYDELYVYRTSPYLSDTDGDGFLDNEELASGNDPTISSTNPELNIQKQNSVGIVDVTNDRIDEIPVFNVPTVDQLDFATAPIDPNSVTADQIRQALIDQGASAEDILVFTDEELLGRYFELLAESEVENTATQNAVTEEEVTP